MADICISEKSFADTQYGRLSPEQCQKLQDASLEILARTGARLYYHEAIDLLKRAGASVSDGNRVRLSSGMVERALSTVPRQVTLYPAPRDADSSDQGAPPLYLKDGRCYYGPSSDCLNIIDHRTGERRVPTTQIKK